MLLTILGMLVLSVVVAASRSPAAVVVMGIAMFGAMIAAWVFHLLGQIQLNKVSQSSGAKGVLNASLITFISYSAGTVLLVVVSGLLIANEVGNAGPGGPRWATFTGMGGPNQGGFLGIAQIALSIMQWACAILLMLGLRRIGVALKNSSITRNATIALVVYSIFVAFLAVMTVLTRMQSMQQGVAVRGAAGIEGFFMVFGLFAIVGGLTLLVVYSNAVKKIGDVPKAPQWQYLQ
jgi:hypothetical protein